MLQNNSGHLSEKDLGGMSEKKTVRAMKWVLNILIVMFVVLIFAIIWTGGFEFHVLGIRISCYNIVNPEDLRLAASKHQAYLESVTGTISGTINKNEGLTESKKQAQVIDIT